MTTIQVESLVEHLFRRESARMLSALTRHFGFENLDLAEEVIQESMLQALKQWPFRGVPENPSAWLNQVARNKALDIVRRRSVLRKRQDELQTLGRSYSVDSHCVDSHCFDSHCVDSAEALNLDGEVEDDQLAMIFACCHPGLTTDVRVALTLKAACGFSVSEIARAFLAQEATIAQRLVRAKRTIREQGIELELPPPSQLSVRLDSMLQVLYLLFNEGYSAHEGDDLVRHDLCGEAIRLAELLAHRPETALPKVHAILSLMLFQASHLPARVDEQGNLMVLAEQDRTQWDYRLIAHGMRQLELASAGEELTEYHVQAAIAAVHARSRCYHETDWPQLLHLYGTLLSIAPSPVVELNRAVAVAMTAGPKAGLQALDNIRDVQALRGYYLFPATKGDFHLQLGELAEAEDCFQCALAAPCSEPERRFLEKKLAACRSPQRNEV